MTSPVATIGWLLRGLICCASIVVFAWYSAALVLRTAWPELDDPPAVEGAGAGRRVQESARGSRSRQSFTPIFGTSASETPVKRIPVTKNTAYALSGLFEAHGGRRIALIESSGVTSIYREQDRLPGGEAVAEIGVDSVTLRGTSGLTLIAFEQSEMLGAVLADARVTAVQAPDAASDSATTVYKSPPDVRPEQRPPISHARLKEHALSGEAMARARFARVRDGNGKVGLRIQSLPLDDLTKTIGLYRGDIIIAVNGLSTDSANTFRTLLGTLPARREIVIDLVRRDAPHRLIIPLSHG